MNDRRYAPGAGVLFIAAMQKMVLAPWPIAKGVRASAVRTGDMPASEPAIPALDGHASVAA